MNVSIIQPNYFPWRGYFSMISKSEVFVFLDDVQYTSRDWRNRNKFDLNGNIQWLTVPVISASRAVLIKDVNYSADDSWKRKHIESFRRSYKDTPFFGEAFELLNFIQEDYNCSLSELTVQTTMRVSRYLGFNTRFLKSSTLNIAEASPTSRLISIVKRVAGNTYLSGPSARNYIEADAFENASINLEYHEHKYLPYSRGDRELRNDLSILDLICFHGRQAIDFL